MQTEALTFKVVKGHALGGGRDAAPGEVLHVPGDISIADAVTKLHLGYVEQIIPEAPAEDAEEPADDSRAPETASEDVEDQDPDVEDPDPDVEDPDPEAESQDPDVADPDPAAVDPDPKPATKPKQQKKRSRK